MLYNGVFGCHGNTVLRYFLLVHFYTIHSRGPINVCTNFEINRYKIAEVIKYAKIVFYLTSRDANTVRRTPWGLDTSARYFNQEHCETFFGDLDLDL